MKKLLIAACCLLALQTNGQTGDNNLGIIPAPASVKKGKGVFKITPETSILTDSPAHRAIKYLSEYLRRNGYANTIVDAGTMMKKSTDVKNAILLLTAGNPGLAPEGYEIKASEQQVLVNGKGPGLFYGVQTLMQLISPEKRGFASIQVATIADAPRFPYRGMHLDVSRHFFPVDFIKRYLDVMATYKLNNFHWHLTDDQGWRLEIKKYPLLTQVGSKRAQTKVGGFSGNNADLYDNTPYEGFYTQEQVKEIVAYAADRFIDVVPEIEMPGHASAAIAAYPILSCDPTKTYKVAESWGVFKDVLCPTDTTFHILFDILNEVEDLFPGKLVHVGGDECPKDAWKSSDFCQNLIKRLSLKDENGLQSYFMQRIERHLNATGHTMIGWDEILEGGLAPNATVMSWRGEAGGIAAAKENHDVIMTPGSGGLYFDHAQSKSRQEPLSIGGFASLSKTYSYDPVPAELTPEQQKHIKGVQANLWTEYIATPAKAEYMLLPRMLALAEVAWTPVQKKDYDNFSRLRIPHHLATLENRGYNYRVPEVIGLNDTLMKGGDFTLELTPTVEGAKIYYTIDGFTPRETDYWYTQPVKVKVPAGKEMDFQAIIITPSGKRSNITEMALDNK
jgi:hexosaminidase